MSARARSVRIGSPNAQASGDYIAHMAHEHYTAFPGTTALDVFARGVVCHIDKPATTGTGNAHLRRADGRDAEVEFSGWTGLSKIIDSWLSDWDGTTTDYIGKVDTANRRVRELERELETARAERDALLAQCYEAGYSQYGLAKMLGESKAKIHRWIKGVRTSGT